MLALFVREFEKDALALRFLEPLAVPLEELIRASFATDADEQRLPPIGAFFQFLSAGGEQAVGGALEEQKCRLGLEIGMLVDQLSIAPLESIEVIVLLAGKLLENPAASGVARHL